MVVNQEQPPTPSSEQQRQSENGTSSSQTDTKTIAQRFAELFSEENNESMKALKKEHKEKEGYLKENSVGYRFSGKIRDDLRYIITDIRDPNSKIKLPPVVKDIIIKEVGKDKKPAGIQASDINVNSAPILYELLRMSQTNDFTTQEGMARVLEAMIDIAKFEPFTALRIIKPLVKHAKEKGCTPDQLKKANRFVEPEKNESKQDKAERERYDNQITSTLGPISSITLGVDAQQRIRESLEVEYGESLRNGSMTPEDLERRIQNEINLVTDRMRSEMSEALLKAINSIGTGSAENAERKYAMLIHQYHTEGKISNIDLSMFLNLPHDPQLVEIITGMQERMQGDDLIGEAMRIFVPNAEQVKLMRAISSAGSLKYFLQNERTAGGFKYLTGTGDDPDNPNMDNAKINWKLFTKSIKGLFGELLSIADRNPEQFFEQAFSPMYEAHMYQLLLQRLNNLGLQVEASDDKWLRKFDEPEYKIGIEEVDVNARAETPKPPYKLEYSYKTSKYSLGAAITQSLQNDMKSDKISREQLHNLSTICVKGLGWEQLKSYNENLDYGKIDKLFHEEADLGQAYNLLLTALQQEVTQMGKVTPTSMGLEDTQYQLNSAERTAFFQLQARLRNTGEYIGLTDVALGRQVIQKIRMASAIAYGMTGEFWNIAMTSRMPLLSKDVEGSTGEKMGQVDAIFAGTHHRGYEKMIGELDLDLAFQRFNIPRLYNAFRYTPIDRDIRHPKGAWSKEGFYDHKIVYEIREEEENAVKYGRSDKLITIDEKQVFLHDFLRTKCVGMFARGSWRFTNYDACKISKEGNPGQLDYVKTLAKVREMGSYFVKKFIDNLKPAEIDSMSREDVIALIGIQKSGSQLDANERKLFGKEALYESLLFGQMARVNPTKFLQLEARRWTPQGEKLLQDHLQDYLGRRCGNYSEEYRNFTLYKMYVSALTLAEKNIWWERRGENPNYTFDTMDIEWNKGKLLDFFHNYINGKGKNTGTSLEITESDEQLIDILKGFQKTLKESINLPRYHNENNTGASETLQQRFAEMLAGWSKMSPKNSGGDSKGDIENLIAGDDFNIENFQFGAGGGWAHARFATETLNVTKDMNPALYKIFAEVLPEIVQGQYKDINDFRKTISEKLVPHIKKIHGAISFMDKDQADEYCIRLTLFISNMIGKDRLLRIKGFGPLADWYKRQRNGTQASEYGDFFPNSVDSPSHSLDSDEVYAMVRIIGAAIQLPPDEKQIDHVKTTLSILGRPILTEKVYKGERREKAKLLGFIPYTKKVIDEGSQIPWNIKVFLKAHGLTGITKWIETIIPVAGGAFALILLAMAYLANQKNKKK